MDYYVLALKNYLNFSGYSTKREFWMFILFNLIVSIVISFVQYILRISYLLTLYSLFIFLPSLAITIRRLHDANKSGFWILILLVPIIGPIWLLILLASDGF